MIGKALDMKQFGQRVVDPRPLPHLSGLRGRQTTAGSRQ
jgi:hypothetical protein